MQLVILRRDTCVVLRPYKIVTICRISILFICCNVESHYQSQSYAVHFLEQRDTVTRCEQAEIAV